MSTEVAPEKPEILAELAVPRQPLAYFDLSSLGTAKKSAEGIRIQLCHPGTGAPLRAPDGTLVSISVAGPDAAQFRRAADTHSREQDAIAAALTPDERRAWAEDPQRQFESECAFIAKIVTDCSGLGDARGEVTAADTARIAALLIEAPAFLEQIYAGAGGGSRLPFLSG